MHGRASFEEELDSVFGSVNRTDVQQGHANLVGSVGGVPLLACESWASDSLCGQMLAQQGRQERRIIVLHCARQQMWEQRRLEDEGRLARLRPGRDGLA